MNAADQFLFDVLRLPLRALPQRWMDPAALTDVNWQELTQKLYDEGISSLVYSHLSRSGLKEKIPQKVLASLETEYLTNLGRNMYIKQQLDEICRCFQDNGLSALLIRGAVLSTQVYPDLGMRPLIDLDWVIAQKDLPRAQELLKQLGFDTYPDYPYFFYKGHLYLDIHIDSIGFWRIKSWPSLISINDPSFWVRTVPVNGFENIRTLDPGDTFLTCSDHLQSHSFSRLIWFMDLAYLIRKSPDLFNGEKLVERARDLHLEKPAYFTLSYLESLQLALVPSGVLSELGKTPLNRFERRNLALLTNDQREHLSGEMLYFFSVPGWKDKARLLWDIFSVQKDRFPHGEARLNAWSYICRGFKILFYIIGKAAAVLRPVKAVS